MPTGTRHHVGPGAQQAKRAAHIAKTVVAARPACVGCRLRLGLACAVSRRELSCASGLPPADRGIRRVVGLFLRHGDSHHLHTIVLVRNCAVPPQPQPIQHALAGPQQQFFGDQFQLASARGRTRRTFPVGTTVNETPVEHSSKKFVPDILVSSPDCESARRTLKVE